MVTAIVAEKPSVARELAKYIGADRTEHGHFANDRFIVTWAIGHMIRFGEPHEIQPKWKTWRLEDLPLFPRKWQTFVLSQSKGQYEILRRIILSNKVERLICATDAGREGELIFRQLYQQLNCKKPVDRLWFTALTQEAIKHAFSTMRSSNDFDGLADSALARSKADWLIGMNLSRLYSLRLYENLPIGRVQTPTLAMIVQRDQEIGSFKTSPYFTLIARCRQAEEANLKPNPIADFYYFLTTEKQPSYSKLTSKLTRKKISKAEGESIQARIQKTKLRVVLALSQDKKTPPPLLHDLTGLQKEAHQRFGLTAKQSLDIAQELYEKYHLISYPRTDSQLLDPHLIQEIPNIVKIVRQNPTFIEQTLDLNLTIRERFISRRDHSDHHAIIPTNKRPQKLPVNHQRIYDLVCHRLLCILSPDHTFEEQTTLIEAKSDVKTRDLFFQKLSFTENLGWKKLTLTPTKVSRNSNTSRQSEFTFELRDELELAETSLVESETKPPPHFSDSLLLTAMEKAGSKQGKSNTVFGLGTAATRTPTIETLIHHGYIERRGPKLISSAKGQRLISFVHSDLKCAEMTIQWEESLERIRKEQLTSRTFLNGIKKYVKNIIGATESLKAKPEKLRPEDAKSLLKAALQDNFGYSTFRPYQEDICNDVACGSDVLLVMPTGAGKSLCYQLPGIVRKGTTLVISPLIALIEDQVLKLIDHGLKADRIHSHRSPEESRQACRNYLNGSLDFLFIAPERLGLPGFVSLLTKRIPALIAIDEAHCISQWGHDFRPAYRMLGERLAPFKDAPTIAVTATATPLVQEDILQELGITKEARQHICGFRRDNIAIGIKNVKPSQRFKTLLQFLSRRKNRPCIVYTTSRKMTEQVAKQLAEKKIRADAYHAGLSPTTRKQIQERFNADLTDTLVATVAFGMGIDKSNIRSVVHLGLPSSIESYYQEIGRAGRDGHPPKLCFYTRSVTYGSMSGCIKKIILL